MQRIFQPVARVFALAAGVIAFALAGLTVCSIVGRAGWAEPIPGDVELMQFGIALAISLALPWCQSQRANIIVDFFTQRLRHRAQSALDGVGSLLLAAMCGLLAWRTAVGAMAVREAGEQTMILGLPMWLAYAMLAPGLALTAAIAAWQGVQQMTGQSPGASADEAAQP